MIIRGNQNGMMSPAAEAQSAFTMIEIAIALAVIAFALVAIIGVLPTGMNVQKDNREDTIVNQDGPYWLEAIRTGAKGLDHLTNYVETIKVKRLGTFAGNFFNEETIYTNSPGLLAPPFDGSMTNGQKIIGLLSRPKYEGDPTSLTNRITNSVSARVRALTGSAVEQGKVDTTVSALTDFAFSYLLVPEITTFVGVQVPVAETNFLDPLTLFTAEQKAAEIARRKLNWVQVKNRQKNTSEIRLKFQWPLLPNGQTGPNRQNFRIIVTGKQEATTNGLVFFQPQSFEAVPQP